MKPALFFLSVSKTSVDELHQLKAQLLMQIQSKLSQLAYDIPVAP